MELMQLKDKYYVCGSGDMKRMHDQLIHDPNSVWVREIFYDRLYQFGQFAKGPFVYSEKDNSISGYDNSGRPAKVRVTEHNVVEIIDHRSQEWRSPSLATVRIYLPSP